MTLAAAVGEALMVEVRPPDPRSLEVVAQSGLTRREVEVLRLLVEGHSDREIANLLFVSRHTAAHHVASILAKLGLPSRAAAAAYAVRSGLA
jgi:DNA-binding CsgD family transcriptional regulator